MKPVLAAVLSALLVSCSVAPAGTPGPAPSAGARMVVERMFDYTGGHEVPARWRHLVNWHASIEPVVILVAHGGFACAVSSNEATRVRLNQPHACGWRATPPA